MIQHGYTELCQEHLHRQRRMVWCIVSGEGSRNNSSKNQIFAFLTITELLSELQCSDSDCYLDQMTIFFMFVPVFDVHVVFGRFSSLFETFKSFKIEYTINIHVRTFSSQRCQTWNLLFKCMISVKNPQIKLPVNNGIWMEFQPQMHPRRKQMSLYQ